MSTNTNTDLTEEDAADLQFPKDISNQSIECSFISNFYNEEEVDKCSNCDIELEAPYIYCVVCSCNICCACFASGVEFSEHHNDHSYSVINDNFVLFSSSDWTAREEIVLLNSILTYNNWDVVARQLPNRTVKEIKDHYDYYYIQRNGSNLLPRFKETETSVFPKPIIPFRFRLTDVEEPPRYSSNSIGYHSLAGYNPTRSDFELEYDANAEDLVSNLTLDNIDKKSLEYKLITNLQCAIIKSYNRRLKERQRRKSIIRNHGLILIRKTIASLHRYDVTITRSVYERLLRFMQFYEGMQFDYLLEGLHRAGELKLQISRLCEFVRKGIKTLEEARLYVKLKQAHDESNAEVKTFASNPQFNWKVKTNSLPTPIPLFTKRRGTYIPIEIIGMPGYEKLLPKEKELCRNVRLVPLTYLELKDILIAENKKMGSLKLQTARRLLKIDVNKTRRLYDFLAQEGYINKE